MVGILLLQSPNVLPNPFFGFQHLREIYLKADPNYQSNISVPVLWDKKKNTIVSNESAEIIQMFNNQFNDFCATPEQAKLDLYPQQLKAEIDSINEIVYANVNQGVYRCGFATAQEAYDVAIVKLFEELENLEQRLAKQRYLVGSQLTLADVRLFTTLLRFDWVYHGHFKCNKKRLVDFPNLWAYVRDIYNTGTIAETVDRDHIIWHYYHSLRNVNPTGIVPIGPTLDFKEPHGREKLH